MPVFESLVYLLLCLVPSLPPGLVLSLLPQERVLAGRCGHNQYPSLCLEQWTAPGNSLVIKINFQNVRNPLLQTRLEMALCPSLYYPTPYDTTAGGRTKPPARPYLGGLSPFAAQHPSLTPCYSPRSPSSPMLSATLIPHPKPT